MRRFSGVVPYAFDPAGKIHMLVAREGLGRDKGKWSGFAGGYESGENPLDAAVREFFEESMGLFGPPKTLRALLTRTAIKLDVQNGTHFLLPVQYQPYLPHMFEGIRAMYASVRDPDEYTPFVEKDAIMWIPLDSSSPEVRRMPFRGGFFHDIPLFERAISRK